MEVLPFLYIIVVFVIAFSYGNMSIMGWWITFLINLFLTPFVGLLLVYIFPKRPKAVCLIDFKEFEAGMTYHYTMRFNKYNEKVFSVFNGFMIDVTKKDFATHFAEVKNINAYKSIQKVSLK